MKILSLIFYILIGLFLIILAIGFISHGVSQPQVVINTSSGLISHFLSPFGSENTDQIILDTTPARKMEEGKNLIFLQNMGCQVPPHSFSGNTYFICIGKEVQEKFQKVKSFDFPVGYVILGDSLFPLTTLMIDDFQSYDQSIIKKEISEKGYDIKKTIFQFVEPSNTDTRVKVDLDSFEAIDYLYARDKNSVYYQGRIVYGIDPKTMKIIDNERVQDKNWVAYNGEVISEVHGTIQILSEGYWKDDTTVFNYGTKKSELDPKTFEIFYNSFSKDKFGVYWTTGEKIPLLDSSSFETKGWIWGIDKDYISCGNTIIPHSDSKTFRNYETGINLQLGNYGFAGDKNFVYFCGANIPVTLRDADPASFKSLMPMEEGAPPYFWEGKDKNHTYQCNVTSGKCTKT